MKFLKFLLFLLVILALGVAGFLWYLGLFSNVELREETTGPFHVLVRDFKGDYSETGMEIALIKDDLASRGFDISTGFAMYMDNPRDVTADSLMSRLGILIKIEDLLLIQKLEGDYNHVLIERDVRLTTEFPYRNKFSIIAGIFKLYPIFEDYAEERNMQFKPIYEFYHFDIGKVLYVMDLVPEN